MKHTSLFALLLALLCCSGFASAVPASGVLATVPDDKDAKSWQQEGLANFKARQFDQARAAFAKADELKPEDGLTLYYRGVLEYMQGQTHDRDARTLFDRSAAIESPVQGSANLMKFAMLKYITVEGRSFTKEFDAWRAGLEPDSWIAQTANYMRRPVSNEKYVAQRETHRGEGDQDLLDLQMHLFINLRCLRNLYGRAADACKAALLINGAGTVEWELCLASFSRLGYKYNWAENLGYSYEPNLKGTLEVKIRDSASFAMARGLKNGDEILELDGMPADLQVLDLTLASLFVGDAYTMKIRRGGEEQELLLVVDTLNYRMRPIQNRRER